MSPARPSHPDGRAFLRACPLAAWRPAPVVWLHIAAPALQLHPAAPPSRASQLHSAAPPSRVSQLHSASPPSRASQLRPSRSHITCILVSSRLLKGPSTCHFARGVSRPSRGRPRLETPLPQARSPTPSCCSLDAGLPISHRRQRVPARQSLPEGLGPAAGGAESSRGARGREECQRPRACG